jgi:hypothetical protein
MIQERKEETNEWLNGQRKDWQQKWMDDTGVTQH